MDYLGSTAKECRGDLSLAGLGHTCTNSSFTVLRHSKKRRPPSTNSAGVAPTYKGADPPFSWLKCIARWPGYSHAASYRARLPLYNRKIPSMLTYRGRMPPDGRGDRRQCPMPVYWSA
jgi:hypothetical protein